MHDGVRSWVVRLLRVPPDPRVPDGDRSGVRVFRAAPSFYRYNLVRWGLAQAGALVGLVVGLVLIRWLPDWGGIPRILAFMELVAWIGFLVQLPITYAMLRLDYDLRWYIVTDRSLRIREGLNRMREQTMTFANVQNLSIRQGPLQRLLGIADVEVRTAGGGSGESSGKEGMGRPLHVGVFRGVDNAAEIREAIRERVRLHRDAGLGDPDDADRVDGQRRDEPTGPGAASPAAVAAARELLGEMRQLRAALTA